MRHLKSSCKVKVITQQWRIRDFPQEAPSTNKYVNFFQHFGNKELNFGIGAPLLIRDS